MSRLSAVLLALLTTPFFGVPAYAEIIRFEANLTRDQEPPPSLVVGGSGGLPTLTSTGAPRPVSFGTGVFFLDTIVPFMTMSVTIFNIDVTGTQTPDTFDNLVNAHIHAGPTAIPGISNAPVRWGFFGSPDNDTSPKQLVVTPFASGVGGTFTSIWDGPEGNGAGVNLTTMMPFILGQLSYINFHTVQFGGGEIRGQLLIVPEPGSLALLGLGLLGLAGLRRRSA